MVRSLLSGTSSYETLTRGAGGGTSDSCVRTNPDTVIARMTTRATSNATATTGAAPDAPPPNVPAR